MSYEAKIRIYLCFAVGFFSDSRFAVFVILYKIPKDILVAVPVISNI